jgi:ribosome biogenesis protein Nip4
VYVCISDEPLAFSSGLTIHSILDDHGIPIIIRTSYREGFAMFFNEILHDTHKFENIFTFPLLCDPCCLKLIFRGNRELIARAIHEEYILQRQKAGEISEMNTSMLSWQEIPHYLRESNRKQADHILKRLQTIFCSVTLRSDWDEPLFEFSAEEVKILARMEHDRWMQERSSAEFVYGPIRDDKKKTHPSFVPWDELSDSEKKKDCDAIEAIPKILAKVDLKIIRQKNQ